MTPEQIETLKENANLASVGYLKGFPQPAITFSSEGVSVGGTETFGGLPLWTGEYPIETLQINEPEPYTPNTWLNTKNLKDAFYRGGPYKFSGERQIFYLIRADKDSATLPSSPSPSSTNLLRKGSTGSEVRKVQEELKRRGFYTGLVDGVFGSLTESAVREFQRRNGLVVDGIVGNTTLSALSLPLPGSILSPQRGTVEVDTSNKPPLEVLNAINIDQRLIPTIEGSISLAGNSTLDQIRIAEKIGSVLPTQFTPERGVIQYETKKLTPDLQSTPDLRSIPNRWEFIVAPGSISWSKTGEVNTDSPYGANSKFVYYNNTSMRTLSLGEVQLEGFSVGKSVEDVIKSLEKCMEIDRNPRGFMSPYVWKLYGLGKLYGYFLITGVQLNEILRDDSGRATRATASINLLEVPEYQVYDGRDLARSGDLAKANFSTCSSTPGNSKSSSSVSTTTPQSSAGRGLGSGTLIGDSPVGVTREIAFNEGFCLNTYPAGKIARSCFGNNRLGGKTVKFGDTFTADFCTQELYRQLNEEYIPGAIRGAGGLENWNKLTNGQKAALIDLSWYGGAFWYQAGQPWEKKISEAIRAGNLSIVPDLYGREANRKKRFRELWNGTRQVGDVPDAQPRSNCRGL